jgi:hypothetical protein
VALTLILVGLKQELGQPQDYFNYLIYMFFFVSSKMINRKGFAICRGFSKMKKLFAKAGVA